MDEFDDINPITVLKCQSCMGTCFLFYTQMYKYNSDKASICKQIKILKGKKTMHQSCRRVISGETSQVTNNFSMRVHELLATCWVSRSLATQWICCIYWCMRQDLTLKNVIPKSKDDLTSKLSSQNQRTSYAQSLKYEPPLSVA